jgi:signal peptidase II
MIRTVDQKEMSMRNISRLLLVTALLISCVGCDQISKQVVRNRMTLTESHSYLGDTVRLLYVENTGAFLGLGDSLSESVRITLLQGGVGLIVLGLVWAAAFARDMNRWQIIALALLAAGGLGNLIDRVLYDGRVTDFLNVGIGSLRTGIFNLADMVEVAGIVLFALSWRNAAATGRPS